MKITKLLVGMVVLCLCCPFNGWGKDKITWLIKHWPPFMVLDDTRQVITGGQRGIQLKLLQQALVDYGHINVEMPWNRFWYLVEKEEKVCNCMSLKTREREMFAAFSIPISIALPNQIIMRRETARKLGFPKSLSLVELMKNRQFTGRLIAKRSYSMEIDQLLKQYETQSNITREYIDEQTVLKMLAKKRMDYILEYPFVVTKTINREFPQLKGQLVNIPINEISPYYYAYVACPKNEWGNTVIIKINEALKQLRPTKAFRDALSQTYAGENLNTVLRYYDAYLIGGEN
ncbi:MAG: TIGR02285 family protein [Desulfobacter sp.]|nr:MAG: TIGR02285 family protein [Desulfobacter sp.]